MAKIWKSCRKIRKTKNEVYKDAMKKLRSDLNAGKWKRETPQLRYNKILKQWLRSGRTEKAFIVLGAEKALKVLKG